MLEHLVYFTGVGLFVTEKCSNVTHLTEDWNISSFGAWDLFFFNPCKEKEFISL